MSDEQARTAPEASILRAEDAQRIVADAARRYFEGRRSRVDAFVDRHFSLAGSAGIHRKAVGWDMVKAPANIALAVPQLATKLAAAGAKAVGAGRASAYLGYRKLMFNTAVGHEIEGLIITDLLELPFRQGERESRRDALSDGSSQLRSCRMRCMMHWPRLAGAAMTLRFGSGLRRRWRPMRPRARLRPRLQRL